MKYIVLFATLLLQSCYSTDLTDAFVNAKTRVGVDISEIEIKELSKAKMGESCFYRLGSIRLWGKKSIFDAAKTAGISRILITAKQERWYLFFNKQCVIAYGDNPAIFQPIEKPAEKLSEKLSTKLDESKPKTEESLKTSDLEKAKQSIEGN